MPVLARLVTLLSLLLLLPACSHFATQPELTPGGWVAKGRIGIRTAEQSENAYFAWQQQDNRYQVNLTGPLGQGNVELKGSPDGLTLRRPGEPDVSATSPEQLMRQLLGWSIPLQGMPYWLQGRPYPQAPYDSTTDTDNQQLKSLKQLDWQLDYLSYMETPAGPLPKKLRASHGPYRITLIIQQWQHAQ